MPIRTPTSGGGGTTRVILPSGPVRTPTRARAAPAPSGGSHSFLGSITHAVTHPGLSDVIAAISPPMAAAWAAEHSHIPGLVQTGRAAQALFESPLYLAAHPKAGAHNLGTIARGIVESPYALYKASGLDPILQSAAHPMQHRGGSSTSLLPSRIGGITVPPGASSSDASALRALTALWHGVKADYSARYGKNWKKNAKKLPLFNVADLLMVTGPTSKLVSASKALRALSEMGVGSEEILAARRAILDHPGDVNWNKLGPVDKLKVVKAEVRQPGLMTTGKARTRTITTRSGAGEPIITEQPLSETPFRRGFQNANDALAQSFPHLPLFGAQSRVLRGTARQISRATDRVLASIPGADSLPKLSTAGKERAYWEAQIIKHTTDEVGNVTHNHEAVTARLTQLHEALTHEYGHPAWEAKVKADFPELADTMDMAKQRAFGNNTLKGLEDAIKYKPGKHYENVINAMKHATDVGENVIRDTEGFTALRNVRTKLLDRLRLLPEGSPEIAKVHDQIARVDDVLNTKQSLIEEMLNSSRRKVSDYIDTAPVNAPERAAWEKHMTENLGMPAEDAAGAMRVSDVMARRFSPNDPASFYANSVGMPTGESAGTVMGRLGHHGAYWQDFAPEGDMKLIEGDTLHPAETSAYYSRTQRAIEKGWGKKGIQQMGQVRAKIKGATSPADYENMELDLFFDKFGENEMISQAQLQTHLATPLNRYNLRETHLTNSEYAKDRGFGSRWADSGYQGEWGGGQWWDELISRSPGQGEYHEIFFDLPYGTHHPTHYEGKGQSHWGRNNVTMHIRFQVFTENGVKKLLIEEVQSDWIRQFTEQTKRGIEYGGDATKWNAQAQALRVEKNAAWSAFDDAQLEHRVAIERREMTRLEVENAAKDGLPAAVQAKVEAQLQQDVMKAIEAESAYNKARETMNEINVRIENHRADRPGTIPPPPQTAKNAQRLAVNRVLRHAAENGVDEVIVVDSHTQNARNMVGRAGEADGYSGQNWWESLLDPSRQSVPSPKEIRSLAEDKIGKTHFHRIYEEEIPGHVEKKLGIKGEMSDNAYQGHLSTQSAHFSSTGPMRGTVFKLNDAARAKAVEQDFLFQKQPEWGNVPRGANEVLANGKRQIHMFQKADISTWIHELSHSAIHDLDAADQATLSAHYGEGAKGIEDWARAAHENYARDFERYMRTGDLTGLPRAVADVFAKVQTWMQDTYRALRNAHPEEPIPAQVEDVFRRMLTPESDTPDIFMPHRSRSANKRGARIQAGNPRADRAVNTEVAAREPFFKRNKLALLRSGMVNRDPAHLFEHVNRLMGLQKANQIREFLLLHSEPLTNAANVDFHDQYVIKAAGTNPNKVLYDALEAADNPEDLRATISKFVDDNIIDSKDKLAEAWKGDQQLYVIDKKLTDELFLNVTGKVPGQATKQPGLVGQGADAAMNTLRGLLLYGNPGFYVANMAGNFGMQMLNDPRSIRFLKDAMTKRGDLYHRVTTEMGRGPTSGGLNPEKNILGRDISGNKLAGRNLYQTTSNSFEWWNHKLNVAGRKAGSVVDDPFRYATWRQEASKLGYKTDAQVKGLLDQGVKDTREHGFRATDTKALADLNKIRDRAEQLMLDFDSLTPFERTYLTRLIFLYPFLKASAKYPFMYAGEHPLTMGALLQGSNQGENLANQTLGPRPALPEWAQGYARTPWGMVNIGSVDQLSVLGSELQSMLGTGTATPVGINRPFNMLHPLAQLIVEIAQSRNRYGREANIGSILKTDAPLPAWITQTWRAPSQLYTGRSYWDTLLRSLRLAPFGVNPDYGTGKTGGSGGFSKGWGGAGKWGSWPSG